MSASSTHSRPSPAASNGRPWTSALRPADLPRVSSRRFTSRRMAGGRFPFHRLGDRQHSQGARQPRAGGGDPGFTFTVQLIRHLRPPP